MTLLQDAGFPNERGSKGRHKQKKKQGRTASSLLLSWIHFLWLNDIHSCGFLYHLSEGAEITQIDLPPYKETNDIFGVQTDRTLNLFNLQNNSVWGGKLKRQKKRSEEQNASSKKHTTMNRCLKKAELKYLYHMSKNLWDFCLYIPINGSHKLLLSCCSWLSTMELASLRRNGAKHKSRCSRRFCDSATGENHSSVCYTWKRDRPQMDADPYIRKMAWFVCLTRLTCRRLYNVGLHLCSHHSDFRKH